MALIFVMLRALAFVLMKKANWKQNRAKNRLERADKAFKEIENACKAEEVRVGRPANFAAQFKMMKQFEVRAAADEKWKKAASKHKKRARLSNWLAATKGRLVPYAVGLVDMVAALALFNYAERSNFDWQQLTDAVSSIF